MLTASQNEQELIKQCLKQDRTAQKQFYDLFAPKMLGVCYRYVSNLYDAEEVLQEGFIRIFSNLKSFNATGSLEGWVRRAMVNTAINYLRKHKRFMESVDIDKVHEASPQALPGSDIEAEELMALIHHMPTGYRVVLNLFAIEGYSHKEIAEQLGIAESTSRSQFVRGKNLLKKKLNELKLRDERYLSKG